MFLPTVKSTILFTGDSITDCNRRSGHAPLGNGYVSMVADLVLAWSPEHDIRWINTGINGNNVRDLFDRWTDDVIRHQPDWVSVMIGINDLNSWLSNTPGRSVSPAEYADLYHRNLARMRAETSARLVLLDSFYISTDHHSGSYRHRVLSHLPDYLSTVAKLAEEFGAYRVEYHEMFQRLLRTLPAERFCPEPVHPHQSGHLLMACEWLHVLGLAQARPAGG